jgi:hypothetical protein
MGDNMLLLSLTVGGDDYLLFTANELKVKLIFFANKYQYLIEMNLFLT